MPTHACLNPIVHCSRSLQFQQALQRRVCDLHCESKSRSAPSSETRTEPPGPRLAAMAPPRLRRRAPALAGAVAVAVVVALKLVAPLHDGTPSQGPGPSFAGLSAGAWARGPGRAGRRPAQRAAEPDEKEKALNILAQAEANEDAVAAAEIAMQDDVADSIVQEAPPSESTTPKSCGTGLSD